MEFRRINALPPYVFATIDALKMEARRAGDDVIDLGFGNPDIPSPDVAVEKLCEAVENPRNHRYSASRGIPKLRLAITDLYRRALRRRARPRDPGLHDDRGQGGLLAPDVGAARPGRRRDGPEPVVPDPHLGPDLRRRRGAPRAPRAGAGLLRQPARGVGGLVAAAARHRALVPAQPDDRVRRPRVHDPHRRLRPRARGAARARLRVRRPRLRRLRPAVDPAGARRERRRGRALHADEVVLDGRLAHGLPARQRRGRRRARPAEELPRLRHVPAHPDRGDRRDERGARLPDRGERDLPGAARRARSTASAAPAGRSRSRRARCSCGRRSRSPTRSSAASSSRSCSSATPRSRCRPGVGFGPGGEGYVRFALVENEQRIGQAVRGIRRALPSWADAVATRPWQGPRSVCAAVLYWVR